MIKNCRYLGSNGHTLLQVLTVFVNLVLSGEVPTEVRPMFFGASLIALNKKGGGICPIADGCTLRRLVAKIAASRVMKCTGSTLAPLQLGSGIAHGCEAAVHAARSFLSTLPKDNIMLKLDFKNAFNSICRDKNLEVVKEVAPEIFPYVFFLLFCSIIPFHSEVCDIII